jgi:hypothetical protein
MAQPIRYDGATVDLSSRFYHSSAVAASPTGATETIIASLTVTGDVAVQKAIYLACFAAFTVGTNGVSAVLRIRQTDASGTVKATTGAVTVVAANLAALTAIGVDTAGTLPGQVYVATLTVASASAGSTVSSVLLQATVV